jgi:hypothetical protein
MAQLVEALRYKPEGRGFDFSLTQSFQPHYGSRVDSVCNRNEYWEYSLGGGGGGGGLTTLPPSCADYLEILEASTSWNTKDLSRPVQGLFYIAMIDNNSVAKMRRKVTRRIVKSPYRNYS